MNKDEKQYKFVITFDEDRAQQYGENINDWYQHVAQIIVPWGVTEIEQGVWTPIRGIGSDDLFTQCHALDALAESDWFMRRVQSVLIYEDDGGSCEMLDVLRRHRPHLLLHK